MTLKELYKKMEKPNVEGTYTKPLSEKEMDLLNYVFQEEDVINNFYYYPKEHILYLLREEDACYIIHENKLVNKIPPFDNEVFIFAKKENDGYILAKST